MTLRPQRRPHRTLYTWTHAAAAPAAEARLHLRSALSTLGVTDDDLDDALVMASELVTNAHLHASGPYDLRLRVAPADVIVEIRDRTAIVPQLPTAPTRLLFATRPGDRGAGQDALLELLREHGRGLQIVHQLSRGRWGFRTYPGFKIAWYALGAFN